MAQTPGSLFMLKDNFHSNILNPAYSRGDKVFVVSIPALGGVTVGNSGSFKISDLVIRDNSGKMVMDLDNFFNNSKKGNISLIDWTYAPLFYISFPLNEGRFTIYAKETILSSLRFNLHAIEFFNNGNAPASYKSFNSDQINYSAAGYRELAMGYSMPINDFIDIGIRGKILFGAMYANLKNWSYGVYTAADDESIRLTNEGKGKLSIPLKLVFDERDRIKEVDPENALAKYIGSFNNPGIGFDVGINFEINEKSWMSASLNDLGMIWYQNNSYKFEQNTNYTFKGLDLTNSIDSKRGNNYISPGSLNYFVKDSMRHVFRPQIDTVGFVQTLFPKLALHYQYTVNKFLSVGASNQTSFYKSAVFNLLTISALQRKGGLSVFENINAYGFNSLTVGAGIQYEGRFGQLFAVTDNLFALYHPAKNESFSFSLGMSFLLNKPWKNKKSKGDYSPHLPFYEHQK